MADEPKINSAWTRAYQISQVGTEMAIPLGIGLGLDYWLKTMPWFTVAGALLGPSLGFVHLLLILRAPVENDKTPSP
jgi:F0F1-type ATP synthase assembly protein I